MITFDTARKHVVLDSASVTAAAIWSAWCEWHQSNPQWPLVFRQVGGDALGGGLFIPAYFFLQSGWRVRPMEANHNLTITGNLFVEGGGVPVVQTLGTYQVNVNYTVPVQAQGISTSGSTGPTVVEIAAALRAELATELAQLTKVSQLHGIGVDLVVSPTTRSAGSVVQSISTTGDVVTVSAA